MVEAHNIVLCTPSSQKSVSWESLSFMDIYSRDIIMRWVIWGKQVENVGYIRWWIIWEIPSRNKCVLNLERLACTFDVSITILRKIWICDTIVFSKVISRTTNWLSLFFGVRCDHSVYTHTCIYINTTFYFRRILNCPEASPRWLNEDVCDPYGGGRIVTRLDGVLF